MMTGADLTTFIKKHPLGVVCGVLALALAGATSYRSSAVPEISQKLDEKLTERARIAANIKNGSQLTEQLAILTAEGKQIEARLIRASELANNLQYFYRLEAETGTKLLELKQNAPINKAGPAKPGVGGVSFSVALQGDYAAMLDVFRRLETGAHYCRVMSANVTPIATDRNSPLRLALGVELLGQP